MALLTFDHDGRTYSNFSAEEALAAGVPQAVIDQAIADQDMASLRAERDRRLAACDWTQMSDSPLNAEQQAAWAAYRQALRDLPGAQDPANPAWPVQP